MNIRKLIYNYKLIQWEDGTYGIRRGLLFHSFRDFYTEGCWWSVGNRWVEHCKTTVENATQAYKTLLGERYTLVENK